MVHILQQIKTGIVILKKYNVVLHDTWFNRFSGEIRERLRSPICLKTVSSISQVDNKESIKALISYNYDESFLSLLNLELIQIPGSGDDGINYSLLPANIRVCNTKGHENAIFQYVLMMILTWLHRYREITTILNTGYWSQQIFQDLDLFQELNSQNIGVIGFGNVGRYLCKWFQKLEANVYAISNHANTKKCSFPIIPYSEINSILPKLDFIIICCKPNDFNRNIINDEALHLMKDSSVVINVARSSCISEKSLYYALKNKLIRGAVLDVWSYYPSKSNGSVSIANYPFHELNNVIKTPHCSALSEQAIIKRCVSIANNINRLYDNEPLMNCIYKSPTSQ